MFRDSIHLRPKKPIRANKHTKQIPRSKRTNQNNRRGKRMNCKNCKQKIIYKKTFLFPSLFGKHFWTHTTLLNRLRCFKPEPEQAGVQGK